MSEWKGKYRCPECGSSWMSEPGPHKYQRGPYGYTPCAGVAVPYDRRRVTDEIVEEMAKALEYYQILLDEEYGYPYQYTEGKRAVSIYRKAKEEK